MTVRSEAWALYDTIVNDAPVRASNPWRLEPGAVAAVYEPDYDTLALLMAVPIALKANSQSGVPALALDVWVAYEFRRAGFDPDAIWPRQAAPRVLSGEIAGLLAALPRDLRSQLVARIGKGNLKGIANASASVLGKNYVKQVDVGMSSWQTGPELLVSTKRMDSSFAKNAANRVEESYGDAKNLSLRHPRAALGFMYGLRSTALTADPDKTEWLCDLLIKLGEEDDAYDAVGLIIPEWGGTTNESLSKSDPDMRTDAAGEESTDDPAQDALVAAGLTDPAEAAADDSFPAELSLGLPGDLLRERVHELPTVVLRHDAVPARLQPGRFFGLLTRRILDNSPINFHVQARNLLKAPQGLRPAAVVDDVGPVSDS